MILKSVLTRLHNKLSNLAWSVTGHTIDTELYQYNSTGAAWIPLMSFGTMTVYVDTVSGTDNALLAAAYTVPDNASIGLLLSFIKNKKYLQKTGATWYLIIRNAGDTADILNKVLKDNNGADITDLAAGTLAQEMASSV